MKVSPDHKQLVRLAYAKMHLKRRLMDSDVLADPAMLERIEAHKARFLAAMDDDLNAPQALAVASEVARDGGLSPAERSVEARSSRSWPVAGADQKKHRLVGGVLWVPCRCRGLHV